MAYTNDLVRLATSARLSISAGNAGAHPPRGVQRHPRGIPDFARARWPSVRPRRGAPRAAPRRELGAARPGSVLDRDGRSPAGSPADARRRSRSCAASSAHGEIRATSPGARGSAASATRASSRSPSNRGGWIAREAKELVASGVAWAAGKLRNGPDPLSDDRPASGALRRSVPRGPRPLGAAPACSRLQPDRVHGRSPRRWSRPTCSGPWVPRPPTSTSGPVPRRVAAVSRDLAQRCRRTG